MKRKASIGLLFISTVFCTSTLGQTYTFDKELSEVKFVIRNFGVSVNGEFHNTGGQCFLNESDIPTSHFEAFVDVASIDTGIGLRDKHLKHENYFDVSRFTRIKIESEQITRKNGQWSSAVQITIKDVKRAATLDFTTGKKDGHRWFDTTFTLNRLDFGVGESSLSLSDNVIVHVHMVGIETTHAP